MSYDLVIFDDDCDLHLPKHFFWKSNASTNFIGHGGSELILKHWKSRNFILRRVYKLIFTVIFLNKNKNCSNVLIYDDIVSLLVLKILLKRQFQIRITHLKDYESMPKWYQNIIFTILGRVSNNTNIFVISKVAKRYLTYCYGVRCEVVTSMVDRDTFTGDQSFNGTLVYSGTLSRRNVIKSIVFLSKFAARSLNVTKLVVMAPKIQPDQKQEIQEALSHLLTIEIIEAANDEEIKTIYYEADYGIAFYDIMHNKVLKQNFPLKTLEYLASDIIPIANGIPAHRELIRHGFSFIELNNRSEISGFNTKLSLSDIKQANRKLVNELDCYFKIPDS